MTTFYVKDIHGNLVPATYLILPSQTNPVVDPNGGIFMPTSDTDPTPAKPKLYDVYGNQLIESEQNPHNYLIVPIDFEIFHTKNFAQKLDSVGLEADPIPVGAPSKLKEPILHFIENYSDSLTPLLKDLVNNFVPGGNQDLQRTYEEFNGASHQGVVGIPVKAFIDAASYNLGLTAYLAGIPLWAVEVGGGLLNHFNGSSVNQDGIYFNSQVN